MKEDKELEAAILLQEYCSEHKCHDCRFYIFHNDGYHECAFVYPPEGWNPK